MTDHREGDDQPAPWMRLIEKEIEVRMNAELKGEAYLDVELQMLATMRSRYPEVPANLARRIRTSPGRRVAETHRME